MNKYILSLFMIASCLVGCDYERGHEKFEVYTDSFIKATDSYICHINDSLRLKYSAQMDRYGDSMDKSYFLMYGASPSKNKCLCK
jgi:hypothetical protein